MTPTPVLADAIAVPELTTPGRLAEWLEVAPGELDWLADPQGWLVRRGVSDRLRHYACTTIDKARGRKRLLEAPKARLKTVQRRILHGILDAVPTHAAAHAFRPARSIVTCVEPHVGRDVALSIDLREFFPSIRASRVHAVFRHLGYPEAVARILTGLCTTRTPEDALDAAGIDHAARLLHRSPHLPQGAPTSPAIANLCAYRLDCRLAGLAARFDATYTRYADDLVFSGGRDLHRGLARFRILACAIAIDEGFAIRRRKTKVMPRGGRQSIGGVVFNQRINVPRDEYDALRATLHNCARHGPDSQNRGAHARFREHLQGRISWMAVANPVRGEKLQRLFDEIDWNMT